MAKWHDEVSDMGSYISTKIGCDITLEIIDIRKITNKPDYEPKTKEDVRQGFVFEFVGENGVVTASTYSLQSALKEADVAVGNKINIKHPEHAKYVVTKL